MTNLMELFRNLNKGNKKLIRNKMYKKTNKKMDNP